MKLTDLIIIYLACGSPFGVYQITTRKPKSSRDFAILFISFLLWPVFAFTLLIERVRNSDLHDRFNAKKKLEEIRIGFERIALSDSPMSSLFEFREIYSRYTGLAEAAAAKLPTKFSSEIFEVTGHPNNDLASRCLARKNVRKTASHHQQAKDDFLNILSGFDAVVDERDELLSLVGSLDEQLGSDLSTQAFAVDSVPAFASHGSSDLHRSQAPSAARN